jgi:N-acetyl-alpha-D-glucosaminyl L-malate synthase BshA
MKIGIVCYPTFGGSGVVATELGKALAEQGHQVHFITYSQPVRLDYFSENIFYHEVSVASYPLFEFHFYETGLASKMVDVALYENLDLLHVHYAIPHASAAFMAKQVLKTKGKWVPFITTLHGTDITLVGRDASFEPVITFAISESDGITAVSESLKKDTYKHFGVRKEIKVIPNFVCMDDYAHLKTEEQQKIIQAHRKVFAPNGEKILIHISNFRKVKRVEDVLKIFDKVRQKVPSKLLLLGDGPERHHIEKLCRELDNCEDVKLLGKIVNPEQHLALSDLFILPSETESFGLAALEAMAAGVPVISTNTGGLPEVNVQGKTGFLSNVGNVDEMAANAIRLLSDEQLLNEFKANAYDQAFKFNITAVLPLYEAMYREVMSKRPA